MIFSFQAARWATGPLNQATWPPQSDAGVGIGILRGLERLGDSWESLKISGFHHIPGSWTNSPYFLKIFLISFGFAYNFSFWQNYRVFNIIHQKTQYKPIGHQDFRGVNVTKSRFHHIPASWTNDPYFLKILLIFIVLSKLSVFQNYSMKKHQKTIGYQDYCGVDPKIRYKNGV